MLQSQNILLPSGKCHLNYKTVFLVNHVVKCYSKSHNSRDYAKYYKTLEVANGADEECVRKSFINLCKKYHPDSGKSSANALKFQEIESAYRMLQKKFSEERWQVNDDNGEFGLHYGDEKEENLNEKPKMFDIKHTAPQHRQYLSYDGVGFGTPSQREKQYIKHRTAAAINNVYSHQIEKLYKNENVESSLMCKDKVEAEKIKTRYGMERLVEDLIQESMAKGHFDNLKGQGKPLAQSNYNPYVDFVTHKMNEILIDNGFTPEWITLQKEISDEIKFIREKLLNERKKLGSLPLSFFESAQWDQIVKNLEESEQKLNKKINKYNLVVPMLQNQKVYFNLEKESCDILKSGNCQSKNSSENKKAVVEENDLKENVFSFMFSFFK